MRRLLWHVALVGLLVVALLVDGWFGAEVGLLGGW